MGATQKDIRIGGVWLFTDGEDITVFIERDGVWYEAIREPNQGASETIISHNITASGMAALHQPVEWLYDQANQGKE